MACFEGAVNRNSVYFLILLFTSLHVSSSADRPRVGYERSFLELLAPATDPFLDCTVYCFILCFI
jgi:hypothetical protein